MAGSALGGSNKTLEELKGKWRLNAIARTESSNKTLEELKVFYILTTKEVVKPVPIRL